MSLNFMRAGWGGLATVAALTGTGVGASADVPVPATPRDARTLDSITVTARRLQDEQLRGQVEQALSDDRQFLGDHVTVSIHDGVVTLSGLVFDDWDMRMARRIARHVPGVKRVINQLEIEQGGD